MRSSSTDPGTITITRSASLTHSPNRSRAPKRVASPQNSLAERGRGGRDCAGSGSLSDSSLEGFAGFASSAAAARLCCRDGAPLLQRLEHASKLGVQLGVCCPCCTLNCCIICTLVQLLLPACPGLLLLQPSCCLVFVGFADLMGRNVLNLALESGRADAAVNLEPVRSVHPTITQPILALGLSLRGWMLKPLSLELVVGPWAPKYFPSLFPLATLAFFGGGVLLIST